MKKNNIDVLLALVKAGLWEEDARLLLFGQVDYHKLMRCAEVQSVIGLVTAGIEQVQDVKIPQEVVLQFVGQAIQIEHKNRAMNSFIAEIVGKMREDGIYTLLVKGQGVAQCYERPLWRASGDVDLLLSKDNYQKAKDFLLPLSSRSKDEECYSQHLGLSIDQWYVEIHGTLRTGLSGRVDKEVDAVQRDVFYNGKVRVWQNGKTTVFLPSPENDVFFVFTHFIKHFYKEGMNLRQVCDWCRLIWTFKDSLDHGVIEKRVRRAGLMSEWKAFAALAVDYLGMPAEAMPMYSNVNHKKAERILKHILKSKPYSKVRDSWAIAKVFPWNTCRFLPAIFFNVNWMKVKERLMGQKLKV